MRITRRRFVGAFALLWLTAVAPWAAAQTCQGMDVQFVPAGYESLTVSTVALGLTVPGGAAYSRIDVETAGVRYRSDGTAPTSSEGHPAAAGAQIEICGDMALRQFRAIRSAATDATLRISYFRAR